jgi:gliding motility-associated-like protein
MKNLLLITSIFASVFTIFAQDCIVSITPTDTLICPGSPVTITATASITSGQNFGFNSGTLPAGWNVSGGSTFGTPCGPNPTGTPYYWASTAGTTSPQITTPNFDVACGGNLVFDMVMAVQSGSAPCEGPDEADEGIEVQYSLDNGITWTTITYFSPGGYQLPTNPNTNNQVASGPTPYTTWNTYTVPLPPGAMTNSTMFRWYQAQSTSSLYDNWGMDNVFVNAGGCGSAIVNWNNGISNEDQFTFTPTADTSFVALIYDSLGVLQCTSDTVFVTIYDNTLTHNLVDTVYAYCPTTTIPVEVLNIANAPGPFSTNWSTGSVTNPTNLPTNGNKQEIIHHYVDIVDGCGYITTDSVIMIVNQTLNIDSTVQFPASACASNGVAIGYVSGTQTAVGQPYYNWTGPNANPGALSYDASVFQNIPSGWYYFTVIDDVCEEHDSVFVEMNNPPMADLSANNVFGCIPVEVSFTNNSQNATHYTWNFGNGVTINSNDLSGQNQSFNTTSTVQLIAIDNNNCADTAYLTIDVTPCGCMDPVALNFNPLATIDDESCTYPTPVVIAPNVFTPNNDGDNDTYFLTLQSTSNVDLVIINRWGTTIYEGSGTNPTWDGTTPSGNKADDGTYFYKYVATGIDGTTKIEGHGFIQLIGN